MKKLLSMSIVFISLMITIPLYSQTADFAVISADKMNVLYRGIDNPISVAVPGITSDKLQVSIKNGTISGSNGHYIVKPGMAGEAIIDVSAEIKPGETQRVGSCLFRVLSVPDPIITLGNYRPDNQKIFINKNNLLKNTELKIPWNLPLELKFEVTSFTYNLLINGDVLTGEINGNKFNHEMLKIISSMKAGDRIIIENINILGPDGTRMFPGISIQIVDKD